MPSTINSNSETVTVEDNQLQAYEGINLVGKGYRNPSRNWGHIFNENFLNLASKIKTLFAANYSPIGSVISFAGSTTPVNYMICDGSPVSRVDYAALFSTIGITYGSGDGSTTFNLPDLRGYFVRGLDNGRGIDLNRTLGSYQADELKSHKHQVRVNSGNPDGTTNYFSMDASGYTYTDAAAMAPTGGIETRPKNIALNYIIRVS